MGAENLAYPPHPARVEYLSKSARTKSVTKGAHKLLVHSDDVNLLAGRKGAKRRTESLLGVVLVLK